MTRTVVRWSAAAVLALGGWFAATACVAQAPRQNESDFEVLARGPVHEAYAEPGQSQVAPDEEVVPKQPPDPVEELPPEEKPEAEGVQWIPGYWDWDAEREDFIWVSGFWRVPPPDRRWVPGHWQEVRGGWQWSAGFWAPEDQDELQYLPPPPALLDTRPNVPAPDDDYTWVPGCWVYRETKYVWRVGYWRPHVEGWLWVPSHYRWSALGCVYVPGYWDYPLVQRGVLFAPVAFQQNVIVRDNFAYTPQYVVSPNCLVGSLFVRNHSCRYHFGDYFGANFRRAGYASWLEVGLGNPGGFNAGNFATRATYDPLFNYYRLEYGNRNWAANVRQLYAGRYEGDIPRPPVTFAQQARAITNVTNVTNATKVNQLINNVNIVQNNTINVTNTAPGAGRPAANAALLSSVTMVAPLSQVNPEALKLEKLQGQQRKAVVEQTQAFRAAARQQREVAARFARAAAPAAGKPVEAPHSLKLELPRPGMVGRPGVSPGGPERPRPMVTPPAPPKHETRPVIRPGVKPEKPEPGAGTPPMPEPRPMPQPRPTPEPRPMPMPPGGTRPEPRPMPDPRPTPRPEPRPTPEPRPEPRPMPTPRPEPRPMPQPPAPKPEPRPEPRPMPQPPRPEPRPMPQPPAPKPEPRPEPRPTPQPQPPAPRPEPRPMPTPRPEPRPMPQPPRPMPHPQPQPQPQPPAPRPMPQPPAPAAPRPQPPAAPRPQPPAQRVPTAAPVVHRPAAPVVHRPAAPVPHPVPAHAGGHRPGPRGH